MRSVKSRCGAGNLHEADNTLVLRSLPSVASPGMPLQVNATTAGKLPCAAAVTAVSTSSVLGCQKSRKPATTRTPPLVSLVA
ncbi:hypothetical protein ASC92_25440 [Variovorax sp. Root411]|nr:hypothetical protein ASC92_25440 [Variovorax sp. Root411]